MLHLAQRGVTMRAVVYFLLQVIDLAYGARLIVHWGKTIGMHLAGLLVIDADNGEPIGKRRAGIRAIVVFLFTTIGTTALFYLHLTKSPGSSSGAHPGVLNVPTLLGSVTFLRQNWTFKSLRALSR